MEDDIRKPSHYEGDGIVSCMRSLRSMLDSIPDWMSGTTIYWWGCAFKYLWRWPWKGKVKDIGKCMQCIRYMEESAVADVSRWNGGAYGKDEQEQG